MPATKQTMLRIITKEPDGKIRVVTQSLDGSNRKALGAIYDALGEPMPETEELLEHRVHRDLPVQWQAKLADNLTDTYDKSMAGQFDGQWHAGIRDKPPQLIVDT